MPIRMTDDDDDSGSSGRGGGSGGGGGGGSGGGGAALAFFVKHPILSLIVLGAGAVLYLLDDGTGGTSTVAEGGGNRPGKYGFGATLDPKVYDEVLVHEPLSAPPPPRAKAKLSPDGLPSRVSLKQYAPKRLSQGHQGSCVGWSTSYAARTILHARQTGQAPDAIAFSPSFLYNQVALAGCNGTYMRKALDKLKAVGTLPFAEFAYDPDSCDDTPDSQEFQRAQRFRIRGYDRLSNDHDDYVTNVDAIRQHLAQGAPVVIGMMVGGTFESAMAGEQVWHPTESDYEREGEWGGHAMTAIGYDDSLEGGAVEIMNSWGDDWGVDGIAFVRYADFPKFVDEAYGLHPMGEAAARDEPQQVRFGFVENTSKKRLALAPVEGPVYRTKQPISAGTRFKVEFQNTRPTYTYIFGEETDGSSYVLFPYTEKHDPYCATTGTRLFPRKQSLEADDKGDRDSIAVVISPEPLEYDEVNAAISASTEDTYAAKLLDALDGRIDTHARHRIAGDLVELTTASKDPAKVHALVIEFDKR